MDATGKTVTVQALIMSPAQKAVLMCLADRAGDDGFAWPSVGGQNPLHTISHGVKSASLYSYNLPLLSNLVSLSILAYQQVVGIFVGMCRHNYYFRPKVSKNCSICFCICSCMS
jgi:hypothetical protein